MAKPPQALFAADIPPEQDPSLDDLHALATAALAGLPAEFRGELGRVVIRVAEWPENDVLDEMGFDSPYDLLGLYQGVALPERGANDSAPPVDMIFLYRRPLLAYWEESGYDLVDILRNTLIHEIGHHFGLSDEDMEALEAAAEREDDETSSRRSAPR